MIRLGDGTEESHRRAQAAVDDLWAFTGEMFEVDDSERGLIEAGIAIDPATLRPQWLATRVGRAGEATLARPQQRLDAAGRPQRPAQRASRPSAQRIAIAAAQLSGRDMVTLAASDDRICASAPGTPRRRWSIRKFRCSPSPTSACCASVAVNDGRVEVAITPTYSGCPAMNMIALEIELALERAGIRDPRCGPCCRRPGPPTG